MNKFMVIVFETEAKAFEGVTALNRLHEDGSMARLPELRAFAHQHGLRSAAYRMELT